MSFLTDTDLELLIVTTNTEDDGSKIIISPYDEKMLTPVGYDLRVGERYASTGKKGIENLKDGESITLLPGSTSLITTLEKIKMPKNKMITGLIESKVSKVSKGLSHISTTVDPDWEGKLLIAVHNHSKDNVKLKYSESFCTIVFLSNNSASTRACEKQPDRLDLFLAKFADDAKKARNKQKLQKLIAPLTIITFAVIGYLLFGNNVGFSAMVVIGIAISPFISEQYK